MPYGWFALVGLGACSLSWDGLDPRREAAATTSSASGVTSVALGAGGDGVLGGSGPDDGIGGAGGLSGGMGGTGGMGGSVGGAATTAMTTSAAATSTSTTSGSGGGATCAVPGETFFDLNDMGCTGVTLATGSMNDSELGSVAAASCEANYVNGGTCCSFTIVSAGSWFLTDGVPVNNGGTPGTAFRSAGPCAP